MTKHFKLKKNQDSIPPTIELSIKYTNVEIVPHSKLSTYLLLMYIIHGTMLTLAIQELTAWQGISR